MPLTYFYSFCFLLLYILSFIFMYQKFSEIIAFFVLFIVHTTFFIYIGKDVIQYLTSGYYFVPMVTALAILTTAGLQFVAIVFILQLIMTLRKKYTIDRGVPIYLPEKYQTKLEEFKAIIVTSFVLVFVLLSMLTYGIRMLDINFYEVFTNLSINTFFKNIGAFIALLISASVVSLSAYQVYLGNDLSRAQYNQITK